MSGPLEGFSVVIPRSPHQAGALSERLRELGADPIEAPTISIQPSGDPERLRAALRKVAEGRYDWVVLTSRNAVDAVCAPDMGADLGAARVAAVGRATAQSLRCHGVDVDLVAERSTARDLAAALVAGIQPGRALLPRGDIATSALPRALEDAGWEIDEVEAYRTVPIRELPSGVAEALRSGEVDALALSSPSTARNLVSLLEGLPHHAVRTATIGPSTTAACEELGLRVDVEADPHDLAGLVEAVVAAACNDRR